MKILKSIIFSLPCILQFSHSNSPQNGIYTAYPSIAKLKNSKPIFRPKNYPKMIKIAQPLATEKGEKVIASAVQELVSKSRVISGIKACQRKILSSDSGLLVLTADTTPVDLIIHLPILCEERGIPYLFLKTKHLLPNNFTCVFLEQSMPLSELIQG